MLVPLENSRNSFYNWLNGHDVSPRTFLASELATSKWNIFLRKKGASMERNCGAASVGEYNRVIYCCQLSWKRKLATVKSLEEIIVTIFNRRKHHSLDSECWQNSRQNLLSVDKFHYLNVPRTAQLRNFFEYFISLWFAYFAVVLPWDQSQFLLRIKDMECENYTKFQKIALFLRTIFLQG